MSGTTGLLNVPSAEMQADGTFFMGANYLPYNFTTDDFNYNTGNYYFNITFLPFLEINYRLTILKLSNSLNQDRSFGLRLRLLKEKKLFPSLVIGGNDLYSSSGLQSAYFNSFYTVATKHFAADKTVIGITAGYAVEGSESIRKEKLNGFFCGISVNPGFLPSLRIIGEYETAGVNTGISILILRHFYVYGVLRNFEIPTGGIAYYIYL